MKEAIVYRNNVQVGKLMFTEARTYVFKYDDLYFHDPSKPAVSLTLSKKIQEYQSKTLFPFFFNMLAEGVNKRLQCRQLKIAEDDHFSLLVATAGSDAIGPITVKLVES